MLVRNPSAVISETSFRNSWQLRYCLSGTLLKTNRSGGFDAPVITPEEEDKLWLSSVLSLTTTICFWYLAESGAHQVGGINPFDVTSI